MFESGCFPRESGRFFYVVYEHEKTSKRLVLNVLVFEVKRPCVLIQMHLCFKSNVRTFFIADYSSTFSSIDLPVSCFK
jgi:hypothetical protein